MKTLAFFDIIDAVILVTDTKMRRRALFIICWISYTATYICRLNFSAAMPELLRENIFNNTQLALISSCLFITYGAGQIFSGVLCDKINPRYMIFGGLFLSSFCNILLCFYCTRFYLTLALWGLNGLSQSAVWSPILRVGSMYFEGAEKTKFGINMSTTVPLGTLASYAVSLTAIRFSGYKAVFLSCGLIVLAVSFLWVVSFGKITKGLKVCVYPDGGDKATVQKMSRLILTACIFAILIISIPTAVHGALKDGVTGWVPVFIGERFSVGTSFSLLLTMLLPIVNVTGAYIAKFLNKFFKNELLTCIVFFVVSIISLFVLKTSGEKSIYLSVVCLALITNSMFAVNVMLITLIPLKFAKYGRTGTVTGLLNSVTYLGCGASMLYCGVLLDKAGWDTVILMWMLLSLTAAVICIPAAIIWNNFKIKPEKGEVL